MLKQITAASAVVAALTFAACSVEDETASPAGASSSTVAETAKADKRAAKPKSKSKPKPTMTSGQRNAVKSAEAYLDGPMAFSKSGLIKQLKFEGFSRSDATYAVAHVHVSWNQQAAKSAKSYLDGPMAFSRSGLTDQLKFEGFTSSQAEYGVSKSYR
jgi:hypothetical protein